MNFGENVSFVQKKSLPGQKLLVEGRRLYQAIAVVVVFRQHAGVVSVLRRRRLVGHPLEVGQGRDGHVAEVGQSNGVQVCLDFGAMRSSQRHGHSQQVGTEMATLQALEEYLDKPGQ